MQDDGFMWFHVVSDGLNMSTRIGLRAGPGWLLDRAGAGFGVGRSRYTRWDGPVWVGSIRHEMTSKSEV